MNFVKAEIIPGASVGKVKNNRNGKAPIDKSLSAPIVSRKLCLNCNFAGHLTRSCTKAKVVTSESSRKSNMLEMPDFHEPCGIEGCMFCAYNVMNAYFKLMNTSAVKSTIIKKSMIDKSTKVKTENSPKARKELPVSKPNDKSIKATTEKVPVKVKVKHVEPSTNVAHVNVSKP